MKKRVPKPQIEQLPEMVVAVPTLTPEYGLLCMQPESGYPAGTILTVYGGNMNAGSLYVPGYTSKYRRIAADFEEYEHEVLTQPLPELISEIVPTEYPGCFQLVITNAQVMPVPVPSIAPKVFCKVIKHPATPEPEDLAEAMYVQKHLNKLKKKAAKNKDPHTLFLFPDLEPLNQTA